MSNSTQIGIIWSDLDYHLIQDSQGSLKKVENLDAVLTSIDNILRTRKGERCMLPEFGSDLTGVIFESMNPTVLKFVSRMVKQDIERWDDRVIVSNVSLYSDPDKGLITLTVLFLIKGYSQEFKYSLSMPKG